MKESKPPPSPPMDARDPRAFISGAGILLQIVGAIFLLGGCCIGSLSGLLQSPIEVATPATSSWGLREWLTQSPPGQVMAAINIAATGVGGLALCVFGVGFQHRRKGSATAAATVAALLLTTWGLGTIQAIYSFSTVGGRILPLGTVLLQVLLHLVFVAVNLVLLLISLSVRRQFRMAPPEAPDEPLTPEFLKQFDSEERLRQELGDDALPPAPPSHPPDANR